MCASSPSMIYNAINDAQKAISKLAHFVSMLRYELSLQKKDQHDSIRIPQFESK